MTLFHQNMYFSKCKHLVFVYSFEIWLTNQVSGTLFILPCRKRLSKYEFFLLGYFLSFDRNDPARVRNKETEDVFVKFVTVLCVPFLL